MPTSLYIHIPFCNRKCLFCSFTISVGQEHRREEYANALALQMQEYKNIPLQTIYFGGGTPSMLDEKHFDVIMNAIEKNFLLKHDLEITVEANPESINEAKAKFLKSKGVNRISLGIQSLNDRYLKFLGRGHDAQAAQKAYTLLRQTGFENINLDLMYGFPGQSPQELEDDVRGIAQMGSEHLSLYSLTIEPHSRFYATQMKLDDDEKLAEYYLSIARILEEFGLNQYEISNFAKPGFTSTHNKNYWLGKPYIGLGIGAHGFDGQRRYWNISNLQDYLHKINQSVSVVEGFEDLTDEQLLMEKVLFGLRMNEGIDPQLVPAGKQEQIKCWVKDGFLVLEKGSLKVTERGRLILDELSSRLI